MSYVWRALLVADLPTWSAFTRIVADADDTAETYPADALGEELADPGIDPAHDTVAVEDEHGTLVAVGQGWRRRSEATEWCGPASPGSCTQHTGDAASAPSCSPGWKPAP